MCYFFVVFFFKAAKTGYSDDFTLDDRFVSSAANKISPADQEQRAKQRAIRGLLCQKVTGDALIKLIVIQVRLVSLLFSGVANWAKIREKEKNKNK